jgi:ABC-type Mn2+/Zn2+ transport system ATPase subunit
MTHWKDEGVTGSDAPILRFHDAAFSYGGVTAVRGLNFDVRPGEAVALIGPNGAGKSSLLKGVLGLIPLTAGTLELDVPVGYLPQTAALTGDFPISLGQVVMLGRYRGLGWWRWPGRADRTAVRDALDAVGLADLASVRFGELSGGQQQRGLLARALAAEPGLLLLDEPFNGLDQANRDALLDTVGDLKRRRVAVLVSTHDLELARAVCDSVVLLNGAQVADGPREEVLTLENVQRCFDEVGVELDAHTLVVPGHESH